MIIVVDTTKAGSRKQYVLCCQLLKAQLRLLKYIGVMAQTQQGVKR